MYCNAACNAIQRRPSWSPTTPYAAPPPTPTHPLPPAPSASQARTHTSAASLTLTHAVGSPALRPLLALHSPASSPPTNPPLTPRSPASAPPLPSRASAPTLTIPSRTMRLESGDLRGASRTHAPLEPLETLGMRVESSPRQQGWVRACEICERMWKSDGIGCANARLPALVCVHRPLPTEQTRRGRTARDTFVRLEHAAGLAAGRNALVKHSHTRYTMIVDDDVLFDSNTRLVPHSTATTLCAGAWRHTIPKKQRKQVRRRLVVRRKASNSKQEMQRPK